MTREQLEAIAARADPEGDPTARHDAMQCQHDRMALLAELSAVITDADTATQHLAKLEGMERTLGHMDLPRNQIGMDRLAREAAHWRRVRELVWTLDHRNDYPDNPDAVRMADDDILPIVLRVLRRAIESNEKPCRCCPHGVAPGHACSECAA